MKKIIITFLTIGLCACSSTTKSSKDVEVSSVTKEETKQEERTYGLTGLISFVLPNEWEVQIDGYASPYIDLEEDRVTISHEQVTITITASLESYPNGIGGDPYSEGEYTYGEYTYEALRHVNDSEKNDVDETVLTLDGGGYLGYIFDGYGILEVTYSNSNGAYADDVDLTDVLDSLHVSDRYGTITILSDSINQRVDCDIESEKCGTVKKDETYPVRAVKGDGTYTWYAIDYTKEESGGHFDWVADKDGQWVSFDQITKG